MNPLPSLHHKRLKQAAKSVIDLPKQKITVWQKLHRAKFRVSLWFRFRVLIWFRLAWMWLQYKMGKRRVPLQLHRHPLLRGRNDHAGVGWLIVGLGRFVNIKDATGKRTGRRGFNGKGII